MPAQANKTLLGYASQRSGPEALRQRQLEASRFDTGKFGQRLRTPSRTIRPVWSRTPCHIRPAQWTPATGDSGCRLHENEEDARGNECERNGPMNEDRHVAAIE